MFWKEVHPVQKTIIFILMSVVALLTLSCSGRRMIRTDMDQAREGDPIRNVLVIAIFDDKDFIDHLSASGVEARSPPMFCPSVSVENWTRPKL